MKTKTLHLFSFLLLLFLMVQGNEIVAQTTFNYQNLVYEINSDGTTVSLVRHADGINATGELNIPETVEYQGITYTVVTIKEGAFAMCSGLTGSLTIPNTITVILPYTFAGCSGLTGSLVIPNSMSYICHHAFQNCSGFTGPLTIPNSVTEISYEAFYECSGFTGALTLGCSIVKLDNSAFIGCTGFTSVETRASIPPYLGNNVFDGVPVTKLNVPYDCASAYEVSDWNNYFTEYQEHMWYFYEGDFQYGRISGSTPTVYIKKHKLGTSATGHLVIPTTVEHMGVTYEITQIYASAFMDCTGLTGTLEIPSNITYIASTAFLNCSGFIGSLVIPDDVTILGTRAFAGCTGFTGSLVVPAAVEQFGPRVFEGCTGFDGDLVIKTNVSLYEQQFKDCAGFQRVVVTSETPFNIAINENCPFSGMMTNTLAVPEGCVEAYQNNPQWSAVFSDIVEYFEPVDEFTVDNLNYHVNADGVTVTLTGHIDGQAATGELNIPETVTYHGYSYTVTEIGFQAFMGCYDLTGRLIIPNTVTSIGFMAFSECMGFTGDLEIPNSVTNIDPIAFSLCMGLKGHLTLPNSLTTIKSYVFSNCPFTDALTIPESVTEIDGCAFRACNFTEVIALPTTPPTLVEEEGFGWPFHNMECTTLKVPAGCVAAYEASDWHEHFTTIIEGDTPQPIDHFVVDNLNYKINEDGSTVTLTGHIDGIAATGEIHIPETVEYEGVSYTVNTIGEKAFYECHNITGSLVIPNTIKWIEAHAFAYCSGLTGSLIIPNSVETIGTGAFFYCEGFDGSLKLPDALTKIEAGVFSVCHFTGTLTIPSTVTSIGNIAFLACTGFTGPLTIPAAVTEIGNSAFEGCYGFTSVVTKANTPPALNNEHVFSSLTCNTLIVPCNCLQVYKTSDWDSFFINIEEDCGAVDETEENLASVYPNPSFGVLRVQSENLRKISIYNSIGQKVFEAEASGNEFEYNFNGATGMFLIRVETLKGTETNRVVVM